MNYSNLSKLAAAVVVVSLLFVRPGAAQAGGQGFDKNVTEGTSTQSDLGLGKYASFPFHVSVSVRGGYDDNVNLSPFDKQESFFTNAAIGLTYDFGSPRTRLSLNTGVGVTYYLDRGETSDGEFDDHDLNVFLGFNITHKATPRLTLAAAVYASYQSQPDFQTFNTSTISIARQSHDFFYSNNRFSVGYAWTPRFSTVSSYTLGMVNYDDDLISDFEDRFEHIIGNEFRFLVLPTTTAVVDYRFGIVDYTENEDRSSTSHFLLAGFDHSFSPRFNMSARAGVEFRSLDNDDDDDAENDGDRTHPYFEGTLNYALAQQTSLAWTNRYSLEQPDIPESFSRSTYRTALAVRHNFTARISAALNVAYQHDDNDGNFAIEAFTEDSFDISLSVRYAINRNWSIDAGYLHTEVISDEALFREFSRNRYYLGATFAF